jgi:ribonucleoside-diphosphate reductase beta chain
MSTLLPRAILLIQELFTTYEVMPFGLQVEEFTDFAMAQFQRRYRRIELSLNQTLEEICGQEVLETAS